VQQVLSAWEEEGREEAPDDVFRRAEVRALAGLAGRFTSLEERMWAAGVQARRRAPRRDVAGARRLRRRARRRVRRLRARRGRRPARGAVSTRRLGVEAAREALAGRGLQLEVVQRDQPVQFAASRPQFAARDLAGAERDLGRLVRDGYRSTSSSVISARRSAPPTGCGTWPRCSSRRGRPRAAAPGLYFVAAPLREGFVSAELKLAVIPERSLLRGPSRERRFVGGTRLVTFFDVRPGDYVVHEDHGIARFSGVETRTVAGITRDYLLLQFKGRRPRLRAARADRQGQPLHRRRGRRAAAQQARRHRLADGQDAGAPGGRRDGGRAARALRRPPGGAGLRLSRPTAT
jgi:hypothetical protein